MLKQFRALLLILLQGALQTATCSTAYKSMTATAAYDDEDPFCSCKQTDDADNMLLCSTMQNRQPLALSWPAWCASW
jgi:hypothetical protein